MSAAVLVPGYRGRLHAIERWRMNVALATLNSHGGGLLIVSGFGGEAQRLAALTPPGVNVVVEATARTTYENVERSLPFLEDAEVIAIASDRAHVRKATAYLHQLRPDLLDRTVPPTRSRLHGWWMDAGGLAYEGLGLVRRWKWRRRASRT